MNKMLKSKPKGEGKYVLSHLECKKDECEISITEQSKENGVRHLRVDIDFKAKIIPTS